MLDEVRPGGLVVALTSKGTMDKENSYLHAFFRDIYFAHISFYVTFHNTNKSK